MKLSIAYKLNISSIFLVLLSAGVVGGIFHTKTTNILVDNALKRIAHDVQEAGNTLQQIINAHDEDVLFLANTSPFQGMIRTRAGEDAHNKAHYSDWGARMESIFKSLLERKSKYRKIRFINKDGQELVSVHHDSSGIVREKENQLQNKSHRPYVKDTLKLNRGEVYLSKINLNREFGEVQIPHQEVIRIATPVFDKRNNQLEGLVIITVEMGQDLRKIQERVSKSSDSVIYITNDLGGYLLHPDSEKTYGFDLEKRYRIQEDIPQLAEHFLPDSLTKQVTLVPNNTNGQDVVYFTKIPFDLSHPERFIAVVMTQKYANIVAAESEVLNTVVAWALLLVIVGMGLAILFSIRIIRPIQQMTQAVNEFSDTPSSMLNLPVTSSDEVGVLARSFNSMIQQVTKSRQQLKEMNSSLESKVIARTNDLNNALVEAKRANTAKSEFLSSMSHELRTPLNAILGFAQLLEINSAGFNETQKSNVIEIIDAGEHLLILINEVLDLTKIEAGKMEVSIEKVNIDDVIQQSISLITPLLASHHIELTNHISGKGFIVQADFIRLKQVLLNLLSNAVKYNNKNGNIILDSKLMANNHLRIYVTDSGEGLTEEGISKLFTPFERLDKVNNVEGVGIGLVITQHLVELMGGTIGVESTPGEGSTFWFELLCNTKHPEHINVLDNSDG